MNKIAVAGSVLLASLGLVACGTQSSSGSSTNGHANNTGASSSTKPVTLYFGSYSVTKNVYENELFPAFEKYWKARTGQTVTFNASFDADGAEARAITSGLPVDVAALSLEDDINKIQQAGLITHNWKSGPTGGMVTDSIVAIGVRSGNPKHITTWSDLAKPGVVVDLPNPSTSGGAKWDINAIYYATSRSSGAKNAESLLEKIVKNVDVLDKSGEASMTTFTSGTGDAVVSYENEILEQSNHLKTFDEVIPSSTMLIENPIAVVDKNVDKHGDRQVAEAFVQWLEGATAQQIYMNAGFRPVDAALKTKADALYKTPKDLFTVAQLGGWNKINADLYSTNGIWNTVLESK
ncbi:sulfate ABC transporter substrate-binding protein [Alicyclobacillus fastidiosus]|uniref:Sulfate ABC transporter substrate-binding protein n=1 Tax=Alicyclobacillus fastidiosus TaxID=392011 RepID=A0ABY6ZKL1_9BACL|nr:sulfate ABC transporter substrate-binding protein [Alicyclobacillus fastidiosus]WAH43407.1 sulfate ABC transporter substrate-binding protein [Alicyclobacillus fastidiosus]GMA65479.1 sulfate-binding protein [Alicyclobacillus fastidiosus]